MGRSLLVRSAAPPVMFTWSKVRSFLSKMDSGLPFRRGVDLVLNFPSPILMLWVFPEVSYVGVHGVSPIYRIRFHLRISRGIKAGLVLFFLYAALTSLGGAFFP